MRNVLVTGGSRGLGLGIAEALAGAGFSVVAVARSEGELLAKARERSGGALHFRASDLSEIEAIPALVREIRREFGPIWGLVNNAGVGDAGVLATMPEAAMERLLRLNVLSPLVLTKHAVRSMMAGGDGGRVVNLSSVVAATGYSGLSVYGATKSALIGFTRSLARELGPLGITVNAVAPGFVATEMTQGLDDADPRPHRPPQRARPAAGGRGRGRGGALPVQRGRAQRDRHRPDRGRGQHGVTVSSASGHPRAPAGGRRRTAHTGRRRGRGTRPGRQGRHSLPLAGARLRA